MTIIRTAMPTPGSRDVHGAMRALRISIAAARRAFGEGPPPFVELREKDDESSWSVIETCFPMHEHPNGYDPLGIAIGVESATHGLAARLRQPGRTGEALLLVERAMQDPLHGTMEEDHADLTAMGLAWSILERHEAVEAVIHRPTPWSRACIRTARSVPAWTVGRVPGAMRLEWTDHVATDPRERDALDALRTSTLVIPNAHDASLGPTVLRLVPGDADPVARLRAAAAWAEFGGSRP